MNEKKISTGGIVLIVIGVILVLLITMGIKSYNNMVSLNEEVVNASSNIDTMLKRRADLIPNLVNTVKGYAKHEEDIIDKVTKARENLLKADNNQDKANANNELSKALSNLMVIVENYPDLKANINFINLQDELAGTENRISTARKDYNDKAKEYNSYIKKFPSNLMASMFNFKDVSYFEAAEEEKEVPNVEF